MSDASAVTAAPAAEARPTPRLGLFDAVCIMIGIVVGAGIYESPAAVAANVSGPVALLLVWTAGGLLALLGALCYAELATAYPRAGGDYVYLTHAYGAQVGFLFGWADLLVVRTGSIAAMAFVFSDYMARVLPLGGASSVLYAAGLVGALTTINAIGVRHGALAQNTLTAVKLLGLLAIAGVAIVAPVDPAPARSAMSGGSLALALVFVLWTYGGWNENAYVAAEMKDPQTNIPRSLVLGTGVIALLYLGANAAFVYGLGFERLRTSNAVAVDLLAGSLGAASATVVAVLVAISATGAVNGHILTGARMGYALGQDHHALARVGRWSRRFGTPARALVVQGVVTLVLIATFGTRDGFETLVKYTAAVFWAFFFLTGLAVIVLRWREPGRRRPYRVPGYPVTPLAFCASSAYMVYGSVSYAPLESVAGVAIVLSGIPVYWWSSRRRPRKEAP
ncbi:MAG TPA: amino acid permease [Terriglobales bacterium]|nr:amino acid permease [Terriglobales bacterium]